MNLKKLSKKCIGVCGILVIMMVMMPIVTAPVMAATKIMPTMVYTDTGEPVPESPEGYQVDPEYGFIDLYASGVTITGESTCTIYAHGSNYVVHDYSAPKKIFSLFESHDATVELGDNNSFGNFAANSNTLTLKGHGTQKIHSLVSVNNLNIQANGTLTFQPVVNEYIYGTFYGTLKVSSGTFEYKGDRTTYDKYFFTLQDNGRIELQDGYVMKGAASPTAKSLSDLTMAEFKDCGSTYRYYKVKSSIASYIKIYPAGAGSIFSQGNIIIIITLSVIAIAAVVLIIMKRKKTA